MTSLIARETQERYKRGWLTIGLTAAILIWSWISVTRSTWRPSPAIDRWTIADWLINYQGGVIRRGLFGELVSQVASDSQMAAYLVVSFQLFLLATLYILVFLLFLRTSRSPAWMMLVLSPAFLLFPLLSFQGGMRKELFVLVPLALVAWLLSLRAGPWWFLIPLGLFALAAFSHETAALSLPAFLFLLWQARKENVVSTSIANLLMVVWSLVSGMSLLVTVLYPGTPDQAEAVCQSWIDRGSTNEACAGAISVIGQSFTDALQAMSTQFPTYLDYLPLAALALVPLVLLRVPRVIWILVAVVYVTLTPLFLTGIDYGRWIYLATALVSISFLAVGKRKPAREIKVPFVVAVVFIVTWSLPYTGPLVQEPFFRRLMIGPLSSLLG